MARPDLEQLHPGKELGGWQAVDSTPQEASGPSAFRRSGTMQCGPASVAGVRLGLSLPYDGDFLIGELNADVRKYVRHADGTHTLTSTDTTDVGRTTLTKELGSWRDEDLVSKYKAPEGSALERASLLRAEADAKARLRPRGKLQLHINDDEAVRVGQPIRATLRLEHEVRRAIIAGIWVAFFQECQQRSCEQDGEKYDPEDPKPIKLSLIAFATEYTGRGRHVLGRLNTTVSADDASGAGIELNLDSSNREFDRMHKGTGFPITVVGTAVWKDLAPQPDRLVGAVDTTGAKVTLIEEESTELVVPELEISGPEPKTTLIGEETTLTVRIPNPFSTKPLTGVRLLAEGRRCVSATIRTSARTPPL